MAIKTIIDTGLSNLDSLEANAGRLRLNSIPKNKGTPKIKKTNCINWKESSSMVFKMSEVGVYSAL